MIRRSHTVGKSVNWYNYFGKPLGIYCTKCSTCHPVSQQFHTLIHLVVSTRGGFAHPIVDTGQSLDTGHS